MMITNYNNSTRIVAPELAVAIVVECDRVSLGVFIKKYNGAPVNALIAVITDGPECRALPALLLEEAPLHNPVAHVRAHGRGVAVAKYAAAVHLACPVTLAGPGLGRVVVTIETIAVVVFLRHLVL